MEYFNGSVSFYDVKEFGTQNSTTGKWSGVIGGLSEGNMDIGAPFLMTPERLKLVQYVVATHALDAYFIFRRPTLSNTNNVFLLPFDGLVWTSTVIMIGLLVLLMTGVGLVEWRRLSKAEDIEVRYNVLVNLTILTVVII